MKPDIQPPFSPQHLAQRRRVGLDGFAAPKNASRPKPHQPVQRPRVEARPQLRPQPQQTSQLALNPRRWVGVVQSVGIIIVALVVGVFVQNLPLGEIGIFAFGVIALLRRIASKKVFITSLVLLGLMAVSMIFGQMFLAERMAAFAFLMLIIALLCVLRETRFSQKVAKSAVNNTQA